MLRGWAFAIALGLGSQAACFQDQPTGADGTTGVECEVGSLGCACASGDGCDTGLECLFPARVCIEADCTPGEGLCSCDAAMSCTEGYQCIENFCAPVGPGTTSASSEPTSASSTSPTSTTDGSTSTTGPVGSAEVGPQETGTSDSSGPTSSASMTTGPPSCEACLDEARTGSCVDEWNLCLECDAIYACITGGEGTASCCEQHATPSPPLGWEMFGLCADDECFNACGESIRCGV